MNHDLRVALCRSITARAHLAGAESTALMDQARGLCDHACRNVGQIVRLLRAAGAARHRYWREVASAQLLMGHRWPEAEALGREP